MTNNIPNSSIENTSLWQQTCPCPICKVKCVEGTQRIQCTTCYNWFHFECSTLSLKSFTQFIENPGKIFFVCKICKLRSYCLKCKCLLTSSKKSLYCVGCIDKLCIDCLPIECLQDNSILNTEKPYFCHECSRDQFCNVCNNVCIDGCILCDCCHSWIHYKCTKLKKSQIISYAKTNKKYYCSACLVDNMPFAIISNANLHSHNSNDRILQTNCEEMNLPIKQTDISCNLCLECNPECTICCDGICADARKICDTCLICSYVLNKNDFSSVFQEYTSNFNNLVSAIHFNARSLKKNLESITNLIDNSNINFDLIGITETKLQILNESKNPNTNSETENNSLFSLNIPGFEFEHTPTNSAFGGAGLYISHKCEYKRRLDIEFNIESCETCFVELISQDKNKNIIVGIIYRHPHNNFDQFFPVLQSTCEKVLKDYNLILMGDTNIDVSVGTNVAQAKTYQDLLLGLDIKNLISRPTRITNTTETIIDHILTNLSYDSVRAGIVVSDITDHLPVFVFFNLPVKQKYFRPTFFRA